jgi:NAD(P)-dependent dehydrogenase (short-subunit alcohol dehydrogenase family)
MTCSPKFRKVLVTDGKTEVGQATVRAVIGAGADLVWVGYAEAWKKFPGLAELELLPQVALMPLDVTDSHSVRTIAAEIGGKVDILINTAEVHRAHSLGVKAFSYRRVKNDERDAADLADLLRMGRLAEARSGRRGRLRPICCRSMRLVISAARARFRSKAAALSLSQSSALNVHLGVRAIVSPGPIDDV